MGLGCLAEIAIGNIKEAPLKDILEHPLVKTIRNIEQRLKGKCKNCEIEECKMGGCRGEVYHTTGDIFGEYSKCWKDEHTYSSYKEKILSCENKTIIC